jgi:hypothetical protein
MKRGRDRDGRGRHRASRRLERRLARACPRPALARVPSGPDGPDRVRSRPGADGSQRLPLRSGRLSGRASDLPEKLVTHVLYFNPSWNSADGGCLGILRSADATDLVAEILPIAGNSSVIVRSENSWHAVSRVVNHSAASRRSVTVTFYRPGSVSTMWPPGDTTPLHRYSPIAPTDLASLAGHTLIRPDAVSEGPLRHPSLTPAYTVPGICKTAGDWRLRCW